MRVIPRLGYRLTEFAYLAAASKATRAGNLAFPCKPDGYLLGSYRIATTPEANYNRLTSFKSTRFDSPANNVGPWPASRSETSADSSPWRDVTIPARPLQLGDANFPVSDP